ncbi:hypothetical protein HK102_008464, partial [Quaeritorhiza haematococci]
NGWDADRLTTDTASRNGTDAKDKYAKEEFHKDQNFTKQQKKWSHNCCLFKAFVDFIMGELDGEVFDVLCLLAFLEVGVKEILEGVLKLMASQHHCVWGRLRLLVAKVPEGTAASPKRGATEDAGSDCSRRPRLEE